jgi:hypothetical protein
MARLPSAVAESQRSSMEGCTTDSSSRSRRLHSAAMPSLRCRLIPGYARRRRRGTATQRALTVHARLVMMRVSVRVYVQQPSYYGVPPQQRPQQQQHPQQHPQQQQGAYPPPQYHTSSGPGSRTRRHTSLLPLPVRVRKRWLTPFPALACRDVVDDRLCAQRAFPTTPRSPRTTALRFVTNRARAPLMCRLLLSVSDDASLR